MSQPTVVSEYEADVIVSGLSHPADDVVEVTLAHADGSPLPPWTPGAHIDLMLADGLVRQYSLCSSPAEPTSYRVAVLRTPDSRGGSAQVHELAQGQTIRIRGPRNNFPLVTSPRYVFIAGGIGITPMLPMIEEADAAGAEWQLHYGGRTRASMAYLDVVEKYADRVSVVPQDQAGLLDIGGILGAPDPRTLVYCCGPEPLLTVVEQQAAAWPSGALHLERFAAKEIERDGEDGSFELVLQRTGISVTVPADKTVFDTMRDAGVPVLGSCLEGICGTCETGVLEGEVDHRDSVLDPDEQEAHDCMMVCVSRAKGPRLVLDA
ncbi:MAG: PDR/VanB family oxidoreductase [Nocardioides sp.]|uniref:PDR/VanB family oxidoreductase n=1 Tax=Nocardioides sp. TaxID=35761 RepID=UPI0039E5C784